jgi:hypothetical protein
MRERDDRHLRLAEDVAGIPAKQASNKFRHASIAIAWAPESEAHAMGSVLITTAAALIARFCPKIHLVNESPLSFEIVDLLRAIDSSPQAAFTVGPSEESFTAMVWLGGGDPQSFAATSHASADGWLSYIASDGKQLPHLGSSSNPFGSLGAAALVAAEVFKTLMPPREGRGHLFSASSYSTYSYGISTDPGPELIDPSEIPGRPLLAGVGAVGQAFLHVLGHVPGLSGELTIVDREVIDDATNLNRYYGSVEKDVKERTPKTTVGVRLLSASRVIAFPEQRDLLEVISDINGNLLPRPEIVISALDRDEARAPLQMLWPDLLLEGATGDTLLQIFRHSHYEGTACLRCIHRPSERDVPYEDALAEKTGLTPARILEALTGGRSVIAQEDIEAAPVSMKELLISRKGQDICGLLSEVERFQPRENDPVQPSVSFTSYLAGLFAAAEFTRHVMGIPSGLSGRYQLDPIATLEPDPPWTEQKVSDCYCEERRQTVELFRQRMKSRPGG